MIGLDGGLGLVTGMGVGAGDDEGEDVGVRDAAARGVGATGSRTWRTAVIRHAEFQQNSIVWSPIPSSSGTVIDWLTLPCESARNGNLCSVLCSRISPVWLAGRWLAVTRIELLAATDEGVSDIPGCGRKASRPAAAISNSRMSTIAAIAISRLRDFRLTTGAGGDGYATAIGSLGASASMEGGATIAVAASGSANTAAARGVI